MGMLPADAHRVLEPHVIGIGDRVRTGVYVCGEWRPMSLGIVVDMSIDRTLCTVDTMSLHGGRAWLRTEQVSHLRWEPKP